MFNPLKILKSSVQSIVKKIMDAQGHMHAEAGSPNGGRFVSHDSQSLPAIHLQNREGNHDKFYKIAVHGKHVIRHWGRNGREGFYDVKSYPSERAARAAAATVHQAKVGRGYSRVEGEHHLTGNLNSMLPEADHIRPPAPAPVATPTPAPAAPQPAPTPTAAAPTATQTPSTSGAITNGLPAGSPDDPHGLRHLDTPSKIKNAVYAAHHAFYTLPVVSSADSPEKRAAAERSVAIHDHALANGITADEHTSLHTVAREHAAAGTFKLPFKGRSRSRGLPQAAVPASAQQQHPASVQQSPAPVQEPPPPVQQSPVAAPSPAPAAAQQSPATGQASSANDDPHGLRALDTPSKIRNAVYRASHTFHSLSHNDHTGLNQQAQAVAAIATHALANGVSQEHINSLAGQGKSDAETGRFQLPHRNRNLRTGGGLQNSLAATPASQRTTSPEQAQSGATHAGVPEAIHAPAQQLPEPPASVSVPADPVPATPAQEQAPNLNLGRVLRRGRQPAAPRADHLQLPANFDPTTHSTDYVPSSEPAVDHVKHFIAAHTQYVLRQAVRGLTVDPNRIAMNSSALRRSRLDRAMGREGMTGIHGGSEITQARAHARRALEAFQRGELTVNRDGRANSEPQTQEVSPVSQPVVQQSPAASAAARVTAPSQIPDRLVQRQPAPANYTPAQAAIHNLEQAAYQRGRNIAQYDHDRSALPEYAQLRNEIDNDLRPKANSLSNASRASNVEADAINRGKADRKAELQRVNTVSNALRAAAIAYGAHAGYHGESAPTISNEALNAAHNEAVSILGAAAADRLKAEGHAAGVRQGKEKRQAEHRQEISNLTESVQTTAREWGRLSATGQSVPLSSQAAHQTNMSRLNQLMQSSGANSHADALHTAAHAEGVKAGQNTLKDRLQRASFVIGQHAAKNTEPSAAERLESEQAHAMARQHLGLRTANSVSEKAHEEGRQDILDPGMNVEKVKKHMTDLGIGRQATPEFCEAWVRHMPKASPTEVVKAFMGDDMQDKNNVSLLNMRFSGSSFHLGGSGFKSHGATITDLSRSFDFGTKTVEHAYLKVALADRGNSCVNQIFQKCFGSGEEGTPSLYERMGMNKAHVHGALEGGGYVWPGFGFYYDSSRAAANHLGAIDGYLTRATAMFNQNQSDFSTFKSACVSNGVIFPNSDGTSSRREPTAEDHQKYMAEHSAVKALISNHNNSKAGHLLCKLNTPLMNAVHKSFIEGNPNVKKRPSIMKACMMGRADFYGTINLKDAEHMKVVRKGLFKERS